MKQEELAQIALKAKEVALAIESHRWTEREFTGIMLDLEGNIEVRFEAICYGESAYNSCYLSLEDLETPIEDTIAKFKKITQEREYQKRRAEESRKRRQQKFNDELKTYHGLKNKFGNI